jgi:flavocytochrome c
MGFEMLKDGEAERDVVIIGSGGSALAAAIEACRAGARVALIEKEEALGGTTMTSNGGCWMVGTPLQKSLGIKDSADAAFEDWIRWSEGTADEQWARHYIEHSLNDLYHWTEGLGVKWLDMKWHEGNRVMRWHRPADKGLALVSLLKKEADLCGLKAYYTSTEVTEIIIEDGCVHGIKGINRATGDSLEISSRTVVVATGGFCSNLEMILKHRPELRDSKIMLGSGPGATGSGHKILEEAGGYLTHMDHVWFYVNATPDYLDPTGLRGLVFRLTPGQIWVNQQGSRFHNEVLIGGATATPAFMVQNPRHAWAVLDMPMTRNMVIADAYYQEGDRILRDRIQGLLNLSPYVRKAESLEELGRKMEVDVPNFLSTVKNYNHYFDSGSEREPDFEKPLKDSKKFDTPPYYAIQLFPLARKSLGGVKTDLQCRVLNKHFEMIPGLYASGEVAGMAGGHINGKAALEGTMLGPALVSGRVAGAWAAAEAGFGKGFMGKPNRA